MLLNRCNVSSSRAVLLGSLTGPDIILVSHMGKEKEHIYPPYLHLCKGHLMAVEYECREKYEAIKCQEHLAGNEGTRTQCDHTSLLAHKDTIRSHQDPRWTISLSLNISWVHDRRKVGCGSIQRLS
ncbi:hypothetical protein HanIR_Chr01g0025881 [Helianthus annuus]|nr:hypothetical protein HanIR_Chr01g0025881 [Helianthus annuus]